MTDKVKDPQGKKPSQDERLGRLKSALRENLKRRRKVTRKPGNAPLSTEDNKVR